MKYNFFHITRVGLTPYYKWICFVFSEVRSAVYYAVDASSLWYDLLQLNRKISFNARYNGVLLFLVVALQLTSHEDEVESDVGDWSCNSSIPYVSKLQENHNLYSDGWKDMVR